MIYHEILWKIMKFIISWFKINFPTPQKVSDPHVDGIPAAALLGNLNTTPPVGASPSSQRASGSAPSTSQAPPPSSSSQSYPQIVTYKSLMQQQKQLQLTAHVGFKFSRKWKKLLKDLMMKSWKGNKYCFKDDEWFRKSLFQQSCDGNKSYLIKCENLQPSLRSQIMKHDNQPVNPAIPQKGGFHDRMTNGGARDNIHNADYLFRYIFEKLYFQFLGILKYIFDKSSFN